MANPPKHPKIQGGRFVFSKNRDHKAKHGQPETGNGRTGSKPKIQIVFKKGDET